MTKEQCRGARERLRLHRAQCAALETIPDEIRRLDLALTSARTSRLDRMPGGRDEDRIESFIQRRDNLRLQLKMTELDVSIVRHALDSLTTDERHVLEVMHITRQRGAVERLRAEYYYADSRSVYKREARALEHFATVIYGGTTHEPRTKQDAPPK